MSEVNTYEFYQGKFTQTIGLSRHERRWWTRWLYRRYLRLNLGQRRRSFLRKSIDTRPGRVLDLGCGGGNEFLTTVGPVVGIDVSLPSLRQARHVYSAVICGDIGALPFPDEIFDYVVSRDVLGHIPPASKRAVYCEMMRVLKPGRRMIHAALETDSRNVWFTFAKRYPTLFHKAFIERHGHFGLETPTQAIARFRKLRLKPIHEEKIHDTIWPVGEYAYAFDGYFTGKSKIVDLVVGVDKRLNKSPYVRLLVNCLLTPLAWLLDRALPWNSTQGIMVCYEKPA